MSNKKHKKTMVVNNQSQLSERTNGAKQPSQKQDTKKPIFWVLFFLIIFWTVSGILGVCSFIGLSPLSNNTLTVKADSVEQQYNYTYTGNNFFVPTSAYNRDTLAPYINNEFYLSVDTVIQSFDNGSIIDGQYYPSKNIYLSLSCYMNKRNIMLQPQNVNPPAYNNTYPILVVADGVLTSPIHFNLGYNDYATSGFIPYYADITVNCSSVDFVANISRVKFSSLTMGDNTSEYIIVYNTVTYYDFNNEFLSIDFRSCYSSSTVRTGIVAWESRTYYITNDFAENEFYQNGYNQGYEQGKNDFTNSGYQNGYDNGFTAGESIGYNKGLLDSGNYSFLSLMTAVVDAPIQALQDMFGFEILGVNLFSVISGLFTVCVIIVLLRLLLGGGLGG